MVFKRSLPFLLQARASVEQGSGGKAGLRRLLCITPWTSEVPRSQFENRCFRGFAGNIRSLADVTKPKINQNISQACTQQRLSCEKLIKGLDSSLLGTKWEELHIGGGGVESSMESRC